MTDTSVKYLPTLKEVLARAGLDVSKPITIEEISGGVSSTIIKVTVDEEVFCIKQALPELKVSKKWKAPVERVYSEIEWLRAVSQIVPGMVPHVLSVDRTTNSFRMEFFSDAEYLNWRTELFLGNVDKHFAISVGESLAQIHAACANNEYLKKIFANDEMFFSLRLEPYFIECARVYPGVANYFESLVSEMQSTKITLIHGDVSPKNILMSKHGPVFLDAECSTYGDPAFDVAFCLHHILLKSLLNADKRGLFLEAYQALVDSYLQRVNWECCKDIEQRIVRLLPALILARISGKSPVQYLSQHLQQAAIDIAINLIASRPTKLKDISDSIIYFIYE